jgi:hypothetical protein
VLPFGDRRLIVQSYEVGLTRWLEQHGFTWDAFFPQEDLRTLLLSRRGFAEKLKNRICPLELPRNTPMLLPDLLLECGMPFLKAKLLAGGGDRRQQVGAEFAMRLLEASNIPTDILNEFRLTVDASQGKRKQYP